MSAPSNHTAFTLSADEQVVDMLKELISSYVDLQDRQIERSTDLAAIGVDSLTAAEILFALEDRLGIPLGEPPSLPGTVGDVVDFALDALERNREVNVH